MTVTQIGTRGDGSLIGEDEDGALYSGAKVWIGFDDLVRTLDTSEPGRIKAVFTYNGQLIGKSDCSVETFGSTDYTPQKEWVQINGENIEKKLQVVEWEKL